MKLGFRQASLEIKLGLKPVYVWEFSWFWIGYDLAVLLKRR